VIQLKLSVDVLGNTRFAFSPLAEVGQSLRLLGEPRPHHLHNPWLRQVRGRLEGVDLDVLLAVAPPGKWAPDFLYPRASGPQVTLKQQLSGLLTLPHEKLREELEQCWSEESLPRGARELIAAGPGGVDLLCNAIWQYWDAAIAPYWTRMCGVLEDDVSHRASMSLRGGLFDLLNDLHPEVSLVSHILSIDKPHHADSVYEGGQLTLVPSIFVWPRLILGHETPGEFELTYAARGVGRVWEGVEPQEERPEDQLGALLGRTRASILGQLEVPMSTTELSRMLGQSPGSISQHLSILRASGMVASWRAGRSVLYRRTPLGDSLVAVNSGSPGATDLIG
jgi:DNA-binding transcriptional ArsR family regulator